MCICFTQYSLDVEGKLEARSISEAYPTEFGISHRIGDLDRGQVPLHEGGGVEAG